MLNETVMSKKWVILGVFVLLVGAASIGILIAASSNSNTPTKSSNIVDSIKDKVSNTVNQKVEQKIYEDESGFSFKYLSTHTVSDETPQDPQYYSKLSISQTKDNKGELYFIEIMDTKFKKPDEWATKQTNYSKADLTGAVTLGGIAANQYEIKPGSFATIAIDQGVLYEIVGPMDEMYELLVNSFTFGKMTSKPSSSTSSGVSEDVIYEEEEVVE